MPRPKIELSSPNQPPLILIADDDQLIRDLLTDLLIGEGFRVDAAVNGAEAVRAALAEPPAAVLMDLMMPVVNGAQATALLKDDPRTANVPILAMSAGKTLAEATRTIQADDFISKPFDIDQLIGTLNYWIDQNRPNCE